MAVSIGVDLVEVARIQRICSRTPNFLPLVFSSEELSLASTFSPAYKCRYLAECLAVKEATAKALGTGFDGGFDPQDISFIGPRGGKRSVIISGQALSLARELGLSSWVASISYNSGLVIAVVVMM